MQTATPWPIPQGISDAPSELKLVDFDAIRDSFVFAPQTSFQPVVAAVLANEARARPGSRVLDIGCGKGIGRHVDYQWYIKQHAAEFWGIEPDSDVQVPQGLFDNFQYALAETANLPEGYFDLAYCVFVMEHVADPTGFFKALRRALKPGGRLIVVTPNARAFFGFTSRWLNRLKVDEFVHSKIFHKDASFQPDHYPVVSRCNTPGEFRKHARAAEMGEPEFAYGQFHGGEGYFPGVTKLAYRAMLAKRKLIRRRGALDTLFARLSRPM